MTEVREGSRGRPRGRSLTAVRSGPLNPFLADSGSAIAHGRLLYGTIFGKTRVLR